MRNANQVAARRRVARKTVARSEPLSCINRRHVARIFTVVRSEAALRGYQQDCTTGSADLAVPTWRPYQRHFERARREALTWVLEQSPGSRVRIRDKLVRHARPRVL